MSEHKAVKHGRPRVQIIDRDHRMSHPTDGQTMKTLEKRKAEDRERRIQHHMRSCVHFTGIQHTRCEAGVDYRALVGGPDFGWASRLPCLEERLPHAEAPIVSCDKCQRTTREQAVAEIDASDAAFARINTCLKAIRAKHGKTRGVQDLMPCPNHCGGTLHYSIASYNGHVHGCCSTKDCASWMQ